MRAGAVPCRNAPQITSLQLEITFTLQGTASSTQRQQVYVMRHGERQDMAEAGWAASAERPWDPPLSAFGVSQAAQRGADFAAKRTPVTTVVASPFTRCIQTAAGFMRAYGLPADRLHVDARVCEWMSSRNLGLSHVTPTVRASMHGEAALWFWGAQREAGLQAAIADAWSPTAAQQVRYGHQLGLVCVQLQSATHVPASTPLSRWSHRIACYSVLWRGHRLHTALPLCAAVFGSSLFARCGHHQARHRTRPCR